MIKNFFAENGGGAFEPEKMNDWTKRSYEIAIRKLNKGELIFTDGTKGVTTRFHRYTVSDIDGQFCQQVMMGVNRGKFKKGVTSKAINQLEAQTNRGLAKVFKTVGELNPLWDAVCDVADILVAAANEERPPLPFTPPFVTMEIDRMFADIDETIIRQWNIELQKETLKGRDNLALFLKESGGINQTYNLGFSLIDISEKLLVKILKKEYKEYDRSSADFKSYLENQSEGKKESSILIQSMEDKDKYNRLTINHYIHAIYIKDLLL